MKKLIYILVATALITITPYLLSFEKGQDLTRGLFEYGIFATILLYVSLKRKWDWPKKKKIIYSVIFYAILVFLSWLDLETILFAKHKTIGLYGIIPFVCCLIAFVLLKETKGFSLRQVSTVLFFSFFIHLGAMRFYPEQPLFQFSIPLYLVQHDNNIDRSHLSEYMRTHYNVTDSVSITKYHVDTSRNNVVILVESWGIPMDSAIFAKELAVFDGVLKERGIHFRMYSRTRTAEREDLLDSVWKDSTRRRDSLFMPGRFAGLGYQASFLFGGDSTIQKRYKYISNVGFQQAFWTDSVLADTVMAAKIDSLLNTPVCDPTLDSACVNRRFIAWTTRDTRFPISDDAMETEKIYYERLFGTLQIVADLAKKHPDVRFVVQGDHEPILSPLEFQRNFYRRWVPYVVLN
jgi:phosphoglycerol transferase MdoB-like AlkP superfamily enzyme